MMIVTVFYILTGLSLMKNLMDVIKVLVNMRQAEKFASVLRKTNQIEYFRDYLREK